MKFAWRKLWGDPGAEWQQLPVLTRGIADEIMRRLDNDCALVCAVGVDPRQAVARSIGAHGKERERVYEALDELVAGRWLAFIDGRWQAFFPNLGRTRPDTAQPTNAYRPANRRLSDGGPTSVSRQPSDAEVPNPAQPLNTYTGEEKREEVEEREKREREEASRARAADAIGGLMGKEVANLQRHVRRELLARRDVVPSDLTSSAWTQVAEACRGLVTPTRDLDAVHAQLARGFAATEGRTAKAGWSIAFLAKNVAEYFNATAGPSGVARTGYVPPAPAHEHVATSDEDFNRAMGIRP